jgi:hypothetical protein
MRRYPLPAGVAAIAQAVLPAGGTVARCRLPFAGFALHRIDGALNPATLRRIGVVAIGGAFTADVALGAIRFWR